MGLLRFIANLFDDAEPTPVRQTAGSAGAAAVPQRAKPRRTAYTWEERGWRRSGDVLVGYYRTPRGSFAGRVEDINGTSSYYIMAPPQSLLSGPHGRCFQERAGKGFFIHWNKRPRHIDDGILNVERLILEALQ